MQASTAQSKPGILERIEQGLASLSAALTTAKPIEPHYNFLHHEAEYFAYQLASSGGEYGKLHALGHHSPEGQKLVAELARKHLEEERGLGYPEDPIGAVLRLSSLGASLLANNGRLPDRTEFNGAAVRTAWNPDRPIASALEGLTAETGRVFRETFYAREGNPRHGILPLATKQTIDRLAASAGEGIIAELGSSGDPARMLELQLTVLKKAGLLERA